ncbi:amidohydrolase family protein [Paenibacillus glucanolyticus]|uniref:amidohydrolase family protein n=1 Tax=Paenibacillus glucanolyticus TaxID=59843 RepID=UPI003D02DD3F
MKVSEQHFVNARLPLSGSTGYYKVIVKNGVYDSIDLQSGKVESPAYRAIPRDAFLAESVIGEGPKIWDLNGRILLPGFIDAHMHLDKAFSLPRVPNQSGTLLEALRNFGVAYGEIGKEDIKMRMRKAALRALSYGTTSLRTHLDFNVRKDRDVCFRTIYAALEIKEELKDWIDIQLFPLTMHESLGPKELEMVEEALILGVTGIGAIPHLSLTPEQDVDRIFELAIKYDCPVDFHTDEDDDPSVQTVALIADKTEQYGYQGKVVVGHLCSLAGMDHDIAASMIAKMKNAGLKAVTLPAANMYLQGRGDRGIVRRGITRVREIQEAGVPLATASDNIHDPFHPFGRGDMIQIGLLTGYAAHLGSPADQLQILRMMTEIPASVIGLDRYGLSRGNQADFVVLDACSVEEIFTFLPENRATFKRGRLIHASRLDHTWGVPIGGGEDEVFRNPCCCRFTQ